MVQLYLASSSLWYDYALRAGNALIDNSFMSVILISIILTAGTCLLMWVGEQITAHSIGNGISLIIFAGIVARFPDGVQTICQPPTSRYN